MLHKSTIRFILEPLYIWELHILWNPIKYCSEGECNSPWAGFTLVTQFRIVVFIYIGRGFVPPFFKAISTSKTFGSHKKFKPHFSYLLVHANHNEKSWWLFSVCQLTWYEGAWGKLLSCIFSTVFPDLHVHTGSVGFCGLQIKVEPLQTDIS